MSTRERWGSRGGFILATIGAAVGLAAYALFLPNAVAGVRFLFEPDWEAFARPTVYVAARRLKLKRWRASAVAGATIFIA